jgi:hypothetical protein
MFAKGQERILNQIYTKYLKNSYSNSTNIRKRNYYAIVFMPEVKI